MKAYLREKRKFHFASKILTPSIIRRIAKILEEEAVFEEQRSSNENLLTFSVDAKDNSSYESGTSSIFAGESLIETKRIGRIVMFFQTFDNNKSIEFRASHTNSEEGLKENYFSVSGDNATWVNGTFSRIQEIVASAQDQSFLPRYSIYFSVLVATACLIVYWNLFSAIATQKKGVIGFLVFIGLFFIFLGAIPLNNYIKGIWPEVELQTGPRHQQIPRARRAAVAWVLVTIVIPIVLAAIYDIVKNWVFKPR